VLSGIVDRADVLVAQARDGPDLAIEALLSLGVLGYFGREDFDRDVTFETRVVS
jgi:hypothetical protein